MRLYGAGELFHAAFARALPEGLLTWDDTPSDEEQGKPGAAIIT